MKINQLSVFLENKPGQVRTACQVLADAGINIVTLSLADSKQFGILRLIVPEWEKAKQLLEAAGWVVNATEVIALEVADQPGGLVEVLAAADREHLNLEYMYAFACDRQGKAALVFRFQNPDAALRALQAAGINAVSSVDLFRKS